MKSYDFEAVVYDGEVLHINDHGNATLYSCRAGRLDELASMV